VTIQHRLLKFIMRANWILFAGMSLAGVCYASKDIAAGIVFGGLIVTLNFHFMYRTLKKSLTPPRVSPYALVAAKSYLRFLASGSVIFFLISGRHVHPVGLFIGLSIVVTSIFAATLCEVKRMIFKEAV